MEQWLTPDAIGTLGISTVLCLLMALFVKYMFDKFMSEMENEREAHRQEAKDVTEAVNNNTIVINRLLEKLGGDMDEEKSS